MVNRWLVHVKSVGKRNPGMKFSRVLKLASKSWKKGQRGGADLVNNALSKVSEAVGLEGGGRRRRSRRRRRVRKGGSRKGRSRKRRSRKRRSRKRRKRR